MTAMDRWLARASEVTHPEHVAAGRDRPRPGKSFAGASDTLGELARHLAAADGATRSRTLQELQRTHGNAWVQHLARTMRSDHRVLARTVTFDRCSGAQKRRIRLAHERAIRMLNDALAKLADYDGTDPPEVREALERHFDSDSEWVAWLVQNTILRLAWDMGMQPDPQYECQSAAHGNRSAWVPWCLPFADIEIYPRWFTDDSYGARWQLDRQATTLIHEWFHKYQCHFDFGYDTDEDYENFGTMRQLLNADPWAELVFDIVNPEVR